MTDHSPARLSRDALPSLSPFLLSRDWSAPRIGIVHLGLGNFHRAHQALLTERAVAAAGGNWGICGVTLQGDTSKRDALMAQGGLYSVIERGAQGERVRIARIVEEVLAMPYDRPALFARLADPAVRIVSLTVTEKGYCRDTKTGDVDWTHPGVVHDLAHPHAPVTVPGILVAALRARIDAPFAVLSCDNLAHNGAAVRQVVCSFAQALDAALAKHIAERVAFPSTMVDRIVPATTAADRATAAAALGCEDALPVPCEPFCQWVIEDRFPAGRPAWEAAGAQLVDDVTPYELAKLRMLNGTHSAIAYLSMLTGIETVDAAIAAPAMRRLIHATMTDEIAPTLRVPASFDTNAYRDALLERFANPALKHRCAQIAMDGSQKIPPRLLAPIAERLASGQPFARLALALAAWMRFVQGRADDGTRYEISDPLAARLSAAAVPCGDSPEALVQALLNVREVFPEALACEPRLRRALVDALALLRKGARTAIEIRARE
ncbi:mannitol dehydrogenase family protein [Trinickia caryophylli]|uniref:Fructuronate reductase n=1 Tax=Trinickia caryophylli TaxID=28094 RepID=A0A1X7G883_TRICW|nr:mannitol dehydrogenase family protein [Trinickia caryophylli]PMS11423.1 mannitol dehydrogenase family protein [Trinickia caryophylli]TRX17621.1 mannitol dehydrogenase family protein [Trinickia caryophylli]WQE11626.1 mannitol dehydrogenase family protein [Trinickia caryophylli]SMF65758.1 fructuronate reductase [Trinickia caryophylli]GLU34805.1 mannitol dehydrogenase [Trinickia caryophylli]